MSNYRPSLGQVPSEPKPPSIGELFGRMTAQISTLIRGEIELTKTKAMTFLNFAKAGIIALVIAGVFALYGLGWLPAQCGACTGFGSSRLGSVTHRVWRDFLDRHHLRSGWHLEAEEV